MNTIRFAVVGLGHIGKRHAAIIQQMEQAELVAVCDVREELSGEYPDLPFFGQLAELLEKSPDVDVLSIATPNGLHASQAIQGLKAGKHVIIEKPMALSKKDCEEVIHTALDASKKVFCVMQNRYSPPAVWMKSVIEEGHLGKIHLVQINCYWNRDERYYRKRDWHGTADLDGGTLFTQFSHFIDMMNWLFGDITNIQAQFYDMNHQELTDFEDTGLIQFEFVQGGAGSIQYSTATWDKNFESSMTILGEKGTIKLGGQYMEKVVYCHVDGLAFPELPPASPAYDYGPYKGSAANHHYVFDNVIKTLNGEGTIATNAMEGMKVVDIIERIYGLKKK